MLLHQGVDVSNEFQYVCITKFCFLNIPDPCKTIMELLVYRLEVSDGKLLVKHLLVERHCEATVNKLAMVQCLLEKNRQF